jgi:hypothetical protein
VWRRAAAALGGPWELTLRTEGESRGVDLSGTPFPAWQWRGTGQAARHAPWGPQCDNDASIFECIKNNGFRLRRVHFFLLAYCRCAAPANGEAGPEGERHRRESKEANQKKGPSPTELTGGF